MELVADLLKVLLPAALVLYAMYLTVKSFINKDIQQAKTLAEANAQIKQAEVLEKQKEIELKNKEITLPIRLQAYERMCLFLERISPTQLIPRLNNPEFAVGLFQAILIQEIRNEYAHNLSQQMYISNEAWDLIVKAMEEMILLINNSTLELHEDSPGIELAKQVLIISRDLGVNPTRDALQFLKDEMRQLF
ncbi:MAG: hypothetical protein MUE85_14680 [Microscillaceae bacterium]|jgi:hypothetical protein|nr:hypothetical protein [Microscillaceae bacterium]